MIMPSQSPLLYRLIRRVIWLLSPKYKLYGTKNFRLNPV